MIAHTTGLNYRIPQAFVRSPEQAQVGPTPQQAATLLPKVDEELAQIEGITDDYYNEYGRLKRFVEDMASQGIDVTKPDYTQPGGGDLHRTYLKIEANLRSTANALKRDREQRAYYNQLIAQNKGRFAQGFDPTSQYVSDKSVQDIFVPNDLLPEVKKAIDIITSTTHTEGDQKKLKNYRQDRIAELQERLRNEQSPARREYLQDNINALLAAKPFTTAYAEFTQRGGGTKDPATALNVAKTLLAIVRGALRPEQIETKKRNGRVVGVTGANLKGKPYDKAMVPKIDDRGRKVVDADGNAVMVERDKLINDVEIRPDGSVWLTFQSIDDKSIEPERIDNQPRPIILQKLVRALGGASAANKMIEYLIQYGAMDDLGIDVNEASNPLFGQEGDMFLTELSQARFSEIALQDEFFQHTIKAVGDVLDSAVGGGYGGTKGGDPVSVNLYKNGQTTTFKFAKGGSTGKYYVKSGADQLGLTPDTAYTKEQILKAIEKSDFTYTEQLPQTSTPQSRINELPDE